jgi:prophage regulatory protein
MARIESISIAEARALADRWECEHEAHLRTVAVTDRFKGATPDDLIRMWEAGRNERGQKLSQLDFEALVEAWLRTFDAYPPAEADDIPDVVAVAETKEPEPEDDTMLRPRDVARLTGVSLRTIKRMVIDGRFPKPMKLSPRRIGWPAREVKAWIGRLGEQRYAVRQ